MAGGVERSWKLENAGWASLTDILSIKYFFFAFSFRLRCRKGCFWVSLGYLEGSCDGDLGKVAYSSRSIRKLDWILLEVEAGWEPRDKVHGEGEEGADPSIDQRSLIARLFTALNQSPLQKHPKTAFPRTPSRSFMFHNKQLRMSAWL